MNKRLTLLSQRMQVMVLLWFNRREQALARLDRMVAAFPDERRPLATRAHLNAQLGRMAAALDDHLALVQQAPDDAAAWFNLGYVLETDGQWQPALDAFARACELDPQMDRAWYGQGLVLIRLQRFDEAAAALRRNTELQPMSPYGWYQLARVHIDRQAPDEAVKIIRHLRGFEPKVAAQLERETGLLLGQPAS